VSSSTPLRPLVVGVPRSGFTLLISVLAQLLPLAGRRASARERARERFLGALDRHVADALVALFEERGLADRLIYNPNFQALRGGPRWLHEDDDGRICFRKYIGVRGGGGDVSLNTAHPVSAIAAEDILHSHVDAGRWLAHPLCEGRTAFASLRNPVGILNSSVLSINALTSEYIQRHVPPEQDDHALRERLAIYKLTDLDFFAGLISFLRKQLEEVLADLPQFHVMRWEELIDRPEATITNVAAAAGLEVSPGFAAEVWRRIGHKNLTGAHRHNFRRGGARIGDWQRFLVNEHLELIRAEMGDVCAALGYPVSPALDPAGYTPFQQRVAGAIDQGTVIDEVDDRDLFGFAFNKSNLDATKFPFRCGEWRTHTRIERSCLADEQLEAAISDVAEAAVGEVNDFLHALDEELSAGAGAGALRTVTAPLRDASPAVADRVEAQWASAGGTDADEPPRLLEARRGLNIVLARGRYHAVPHALGPVDLQEVEPERLPGVVSAECLADLERRLNAGPATAGSSAHRDDLQLEFVDPTADAMADAIARLLAEDHREIEIAPINGLALETLLQVLSRENPRRFTDRFVADGATIPDALRRFVRPRQAGDRPAASVHFDTDGAALSQRLLEHLDREKGCVVAPITDHHRTRRPLFLVSIPKAGTHLLMRLARTFGYGAGETCPDHPRGGTWYYVEYTNAHTAAPDFFVDTVRRSPFGNRHHPFMASPALFNYRNPLDILVSEAHYYHREGKTAFASYLAHLDTRQRIRRLIHDPWLLGSLRERVGRFVAWLDFANVAPVAFEELVGEAGGGDDGLQRRVIWSLQLKLHVGGSPDRHRSALYDQDSPTFRRARIGAYRESLDEELFAEFMALEQDFMEALGYAGSDLRRCVTTPARSEEFRRRPLVCATTSFDDTPILVRSGYCGHNIVRYGGRFYALAQDGPFGDLRELDPAQLDELPWSEELADLEAIIPAACLMNG
jgi:hypothetical protein